MLNWARVLRPGLRRLAGSTCAATAVEFALVFPFLLVFAFSAFETIRYVGMAKQLTYMADAQATMMVDRTTGVVSNDVKFALNVAQVVLPQVLNDSARGATAWNNYMSSTLSSITFTAPANGCAAPCNWIAKVAWSVGAGAASPTRACAVAPIAATNSASPSITTLPQGAFDQVKTMAAAAGGVATSLIVADATYPFVPTVASAFVPSFTLRRSVYLAPRYLPTIALATGSAGLCP